MCDSCLAVGGTNTDEQMHYKNFGPSKAWELTLVTHDMYTAMPGRKSVWSVVPGWTLPTATYDLMHMVFLGTARDLVASALRTLIWRDAYSHLPMQDMDLLLGVIQEEMVHECCSCGSFGCTYFIPDVYFLDGFHTPQVIN